MPDAPTPTTPPPITGYRSRAINAVADFAARLRPLAGPGVTVADGPGGKTISVDPRSLPRRPLPWSLRVLPVTGDSPSQVEWKIAVYAGLVVADGAALSPSAAAADGVDPATGLEYYYAPDRPSSSTDTWLSVRDDNYGNWELAWTATPRGDNWRAIAESIADGPPPELRQLEAGVIDLGGDGDGDPLPFDLAIRGGYPAVYVPQTSENLVYVRGSQHTANRDASATPSQGLGGWRQLASGTTGVWAWARWDHLTTGYLWGISTTDPAQGTDAQDRLLLAILLGEFDATTGEVTAQYYHGDIIVADDNGDDLAVERDGYNAALSLLAFQTGAHTSTGIQSLDLLVRETRSGDYPNAPYQLNYLNGADLLVDIDTYVQNTIMQLIEGAISNLLTDIITALGGSGSSVADLVDALDARYQPICTSSTPARGVNLGQWTTT